MKPLIKTNFHLSFLQLVNDDQINTIYENNIVVYVVNLTLICLCYFHQLPRIRSNHVERIQSPSRHHPLP